MSTEPKAIRAPISIPPMLPDQVAYLRGLGTSLRAERQFDAETMIGPCGPATGFDGYGSRARPLSPLPRARDERAQREDAERPSPQGARPVGEVDAPRDTAVRNRVGGGGESGGEDA